jgi:hypothetical protein
LKLRRILLTAAVSVGAVVLPATVAQAATPSVQITRVYVNSPGTDDRSNASLDKEYVVLKNTTTKTISLTGWTVRDRSSHVYTFGSFSLGAGKYVTLHTGTGTNTATNRYWGSGNYIWNNTGGDETYVRKAGTTANTDTCSWSGSIASYVNC